MNNPNSSKNCCKNENSSPIRVQLSNEPQSLDRASGRQPKNASFHFSVKVISRSAHRCVLHCVAYRSACRMRGGDGKIVADYSRRKSVIHCELIIPEASPSWASDRNALWIEAAKAEKRKNSIEAREFEVTIPYGLDVDDAKALTKEFAKEMVDRHEFAVDLSLHADNRKDWTGALKNFNGYHVHFLATTRRLSNEGFKDKTREFDVKSSGIISFWRKRWEELANHYLAKKGLAVRVDHRNNKERDLDRAPTVYLGRKITSLERQGVRTRLGDINRKNGT